MRTKKVYPPEQIDGRFYFPVDARTVNPCNACCFKNVCSCPLDAPAPCIAHLRPDRRSVCFVPVPEGYVFLKGDSEKL